MSWLLNDNNWNFIDEWLDNDLLNNWSFDNELFDDWSLNQNRMWRSDHLFDNVDWNLMRLLRRLLRRLLWWSLWSLWLSFNNWDLCLWTLCLVDKFIDWIIVVVLMECIGKVCG